MVADLNRPDGKTLYQSLVRQSQKVKWEEMFSVQLKTLGVPSPVQQFKFVPDRKFSADFAWPDRMILVELEGGIWRRGGGAHSHPSNILRDIEKQTLAAFHGYRVFRFWENDIKSWTAAKMMADVLSRI
jgi:very-short-patch-repair endonuclease